MFFNISYGKGITESSVEKLKGSVTNNICEGKKLYGLAKYYNGEDYQLNDNLNKEKSVHKSTLKNIQCRYYVKTIKIKARSFNIVSEKLRIEEFNIIEKYIYLAIIKVKSITNSWVVSIIILAFLIKLFLIPLSALQIRSSNHVSSIKNKIKPIVNDIRKNFKGEEAHNKILKLYSDNSISQLYEVKPLLFVFMQLPILIIIFGILPFMIEFQYEQFLWIKDLSYPDHILDFGFVIPMLGDGVHLLPIILLFLMALSPSAEKKNYFLYIMIFVTVYPFPSILLIYFIASVFLKEVEFYLLTKWR
jgi:YidC/Oxa1 family membrane protein insertase